MSVFISSSASCAASVFVPSSHCVLPNVRSRLRPLRQQNDDIGPTKRAIRWAVLVHYLCAVEGFFAYRLASAHHNPSRATLRPCRSGEKRGSRTPALVRLSSFRDISAPDNDSYPRPPVGWLIRYLSASALCVPLRIGELTGGSARLRR